MTKENRVLYDETSTLYVNVKRLLDNPNWPLKLFILPVDRGQDYATLGFEVSFLWGEAEAEMSFSFPLVCGVEDIEPDLVANIINKYMVKTMDKLEEQNEVE